MSSNTEKKRGFAALTPEQHKEVSSKGGQYKGPKGFASYDKATRSKLSSDAAKVRWAKVKAERQAEERGDLANEQVDGDNLSI